MKTSFLLGLVAVFGLSSVHADQTINYPEKKPIFSISFPDDWEVDEEEQSVSATSKDEMVNMQVLALEAEALDSAVDVAKESLQEEFEGIKFSEEVEKGELNGLPAIFINAQTKVEGVKMAINCCIFAPKGEDTFFMLFNVVPFEALEAHGDAISKILNSIKGQ